MSEKHKCSGLVNCPPSPWGGLHLRACGKSATLEDDGKWYCKRHHKPSKLAREQAKPKCALCSTSIPYSEKYCAWHKTVTVERDEYERLLAWAAKAAL